MLSPKAFMPVERHTNPTAPSLKLTHYAISLMRRDLLMSSPTEISHDGLHKIGVCRNQTLSVEVSSWLSNIVSDNSGGLRYLPC